MRIPRHVVILSLLGGMFATLSVVDHPAYVTVQAEGSYRDPVLGDLRLEGTVAYRLRDTRYSRGLPHDVALAADARSPRSSETYRLYGRGGDAARGLPMKFLAYGVEGELAFEGLLLVDPDVADTVNALATVVPFEPWQPAPRELPRFAVGARIR